jgi:hypothetical protein
MIRQILPNNNERCYSNFLPTFRKVNTPLVPAGQKIQKSRAEEGPTVSDLCGSLAWQLLLAPSRTDTEKCVRTGNNGR